MVDWMKEYQIAAQIAGTFAGLTVGCIILVVMELWNRHR